VQVAVSAAGDNWEPAGAKVRGEGSGGDIRRIGGSGQWGDEGGRKCSGAGEACQDREEAI